MRLLDLDVADQKVLVFRFFEGSVLPLVCLWGLAIDFLSSGHQLGRVKWQSQLVPDFKPGVLCLAPLADLSLKPVDFILQIDDSLILRLDKLLLLLV